MAGLDRSRFVDVRDAGRRLGVSTSTIWRMIRRGDLPSIRSGGRRLVPKATLERGPRATPGAEIPPLTPENPLFRMIGAGRGGGQGPGARDKRALLAEDERRRRR